MRKETFARRLEKAEGLAGIFGLVKDAVRETLGKERSGLMLGLADLGVSNEGYIGAYYPVDSNVIVVNKTPMRRIQSMRPEAFKPYMFHILLHEYLHALGVLDEAATRQLAHAISHELFGEGHIATRLAKNITAVLPEIMYPSGTVAQPEAGIELVEGFDLSETSYIG